MPDVRMPDGTIIKNVPEGITKAQLIEKLERSQPSQTEAGFFESFTGIKRRAEMPELATLPEFGTTKEGDVPRIALGLLSTFDPKAQQDIIKQAIPEAIFEKTPDGSTIIEVPTAEGGTRRSVLNRPGFSPQDLTTSMAQVLSFLPAARLSSLGKTLLQKVGIGALSAGATEQALQETGMALGREERSPESTAIAAATGGVAEVIAPAIKAFSAAKTARAQKAVDALNDAKAGKITDEGLTNIAETIQKGTPEEIALVVDADPNFYRAADELGINTEPLAGFASRNPQFRDVEGALRKVPGSVLEPQAIRFIEETSQAADNLILRYGGTLDKAQLGLDFKREALSNIENLGLQADDVYGTIAQILPKTNRYNAPETVGFLTNLSDQLGGVEELPSRLKGMLKSLGGEMPPTLGKVDQLRREVGQAINKGSGPFKDVESGLNKALYARLTKDQDAIAATIPDGVSITDSAKGLVRQRKQLEDNLQTLYGKELNQALNINVSGAVKNLQKGEIDRFNEIIRAIPKNKRGEIVLSAMNDVFKGTGVNQQGLSPTQFTRWYQTINRSPVAKKALFGALPKESQKAIDNLFEVSRGISRALGQTTPTGRINALFNPETGIIRRMVGKTVGPAVAISTGSPIASAATNATISFLKQSTNGAKAAADLMGSPQFQNIIRQSVKEGVVDGAVASKKLLDAMAKLEKTKRYKAWADTLSSTDSAALQAGLVRYLFRQEESEQ